VHALLEHVAAQIDSRYERQQVIGVAPIERKSLHLAARDGSTQCIRDGVDQRGLTGDADRLLHVTRFQNQVQLNPVGNPNVDVPLYSGFETFERSGYPIDSNRQLRGYEEPAAVR